MERNQYGYLVVERTTRETIKLVKTFLSAKNFVFQLEVDDKENGLYVPNRYDIEPITFAT